MKRKILSLILAFAMAVSLFTVGASAAEPTYGDTNGHWAESSIERWSAYGIIQGSNGKFDPNGQLTCAQLATILARLLKLPAAKDAGFIDNPADAWYYDAINRCAAAGILKGNGDGTVTPEAPITRERAMVMLARALGIEPLRNPDLTRYTDAAQVSAYARGYVAALIEAGIVGGVTADELAPQDNINRASTVTILDRAISTYADKAGATVKVDGKGLVLVVAENVKITGAPEGTKIVVADGATGLTVNGKSVSDDQTYIVPKATTGSGSSGGYSHTHSYDPTTHKCSCGEVDPAYAVASVSGKNYLTLSEAITAAQSGNKPVTLAASKTTTETIQEILDGQYGSIDGLTIELPTGNYGQLELGRATKYAGSNTEYYVGGFDESVAGYLEFNSAEALKTYKNGGGWTPLCYYVRNMSDVTLKAAAGANVEIAGMTATAGHIYGASGAPVTDYVLDTTTEGTGDSYYLAQNWGNITFDGLTFTAKVDIASSLEKTVIDGVSFKNCTFNINNTADGNQAIRYYNENNNGKVSNLVVDNCKFNNCFQGVYTHHVKNVIVTNSEFDTTGHNAIAIQDHSGACNHGKVIITGNTFKNIGDRIIRFGNVGADTQITITYNTADNNSGKKAENTETREVIKAESLAEGVTCNIHSNSWGEGATFGTGFVEETGEPCAEINGVKYISLAKALTAAKDGDTVKLVDDVTLAARVDVAFTGTIDLNGHTISSTATCANGSVFNVTSGTVTIKNGSIVGVAGPTGWTEELYKMECDAITVCSGAIVNLEELNISICSRTGACVYAFDGGTANVKSGTYSNDTTEFDANGTTKAMLLNQVDGKPQAIFVTGGQFHGENPANGDNSGNPSTFLAEGYEAVKNEGKWTVKPIFAGGTGTAEDPFVIQNAEQLKAFRDNVNAGNTFAGKTIELMDNIDLSSVENWVPIGNESGKAFAGTFDGNNKTISNLKITTGNYAGLFGYVSTATIKNVTLAKADVSGGERMATLIGKITGNATVTNCSNDAASSVTGSNSNTGGLIGEIVNGTVALTNLINNAAVKNTKESNSRAGGVVAQVTTGANVTLKNCTNNGAVMTNNGYAGGIVSAYQSGSLTIDNCANTGALDGAYEGNMLGWYTSIRSITIFSDTNKFDINAIGCVDIGVSSNMSLYGNTYFVNRKDDLTGVSTTAQTFSAIFAEDQIGTSPKALWDKLIAFYKFAKLTNSNFDDYPETYWSMFNQPVGYSEPDWDSYFDGYNAQCGEGNKLQKSDFTSATWRKKIVYLAP